MVTSKRKSSYLCVVRNISFGNFFGTLIPAALKLFTYFVKYDSRLNVLLGLNAIVANNNSIVLIVPFIILQLVPMICIVTHDSTANWSILGYRVANIAVGITLQFIVSLTIFPVTTVSHAKDLTGQALEEAALATEEAFELLARSKTELKGIESGSSKLPSLSENLSRNAQEVANGDGGKDDSGLVKQGGAFGFIKTFLVNWRNTKQKSTKSAIAPKGANTTEGANRRAAMSHIQSAHTLLTKMLSMGREGKMEEGLFGRGLIVAAWDRHSAPLGQKRLFIGYALLNYLTGLAVLISDHQRYEETGVWELDETWQSSTRLAGEQIAENLRALRLAMFGYASFADAEESLKPIEAIKRHLTGLMAESSSGVGGRLGAVAGVDKSDGNLAAAVTLTGVYSLSRRLAGVYHTAECAFELKKGAAATSSAAATAAETAGNAEFFSQEQKETESEDIQRRKQEAFERHLVAASLAVAHPQSEAVEGLADRSSTDPSLQSVELKQLIII